MEWRRVLKRKNPHILVDTLSTAGFWRIVVEAFIGTQNITFDRHVILIAKQLWGETIQHFYENPKKLATNCDFKNKEETLIRDVFITKLIGPEMQKEFLKKTVLSYTIRFRQSLAVRVNILLSKVRFAERNANFNYFRLLAVPDTKRERERERERETTEFELGK